MSERGRGNLTLLRCMQRERIFRGAEAGRPEDGVDGLEPAVGPAHPVGLDALEHGPALVGAERVGEPFLLGPGSAVGLREGLANVRHAAAVEVVAPVRALEVTSSCIFDVLEDHTELGLSVIESLSAALLDAAAAVDAQTS